MTTDIAEIKTGAGRIWVTRFSRGRGKRLGYQFAIEVDNQCLLMDCRHDELAAFLAAIIKGDFDFMVILDIMNP